MSRTLPNPGNYAARRNAPIVVQESEAGALLAWIPYMLVSADTQYTGKHCLTLGAKDGTVQSKNIATLRKIWPDWDPTDFFGLEDIPIPEDGGAEFELADCYHDDSYTPAGSDQPVIQFKAQWLNPLGGTQNLPTPLGDVERKALVTKWGSKFRAVSASAGGKPAAKSATSTGKPAQNAPKAAQAPARAAVAGPPGRRGSPAQGGQKRTATQEEVWDALTKANPNEDESVLADQYYAAQDEVAPGANGELTPGQWGEVLDKLGL